MYRHRCTDTDVQTQTNSTHLKRFDALDIIDVNLVHLFLELVSTWLAHNLNHHTAPGSVAASAAACRLKLQQRRKEQTQPLLVHDPSGNTAPTPHPLLKREHNSCMSTHICTHLHINTHDNTNTHAHTHIHENAKTRAHLYAHPSPLPWLRSSVWSEETSEYSRVAP